MCILQGVKVLPQLISDDTYMTQTANWKDYLNLCKPRVVALMLITSYAGMLLAVPHLSDLGVSSLLYGGLGIALAAAAGGTANQLIDRRIDAIMARTRKRPLPQHKISSTQALLQVMILSLASIVLLYCLVNPQTAALTLATLLGYAVVYSAYLKRATPQNIVIGGLAGAMPPMLGWAAASGQLLGSGWLLVLLIYSWTPPHFWSLAIHRRQDYAHASIPMLPITHGSHFTKLNILIYTCIMQACSYLLVAIGLCHWIYALGVSLLNLVFLYYAVQVYRKPLSAYPLATFRYSIIYLSLIFPLLVVDHLLLA